MALAGLVEKFEQQFTVIAARIFEEDKGKDRSSPVIVGETTGGWSLVSPGLGTKYSHCTACLIIACKVMNYVGYGNKLVCGCLSEEIQ